MKCKELQIGDWVQDENGFQWQIIGVGDDYAYATFEDNEGDPWEFDDKDDQPEGIPLTKEMLDANGFRYENENNGFGTYFCSRIESRDSAFSMYIYVRWVESSEGRTPIGIYCAERENSKDNAVTIRREFYVHTLQHALRLVGLSEIADNFKV